eukprot:m.1556 g.1556  ORF g.1556 m.1556 type:complete len:67 (-) comp1460_c0_seq2:18-218(-)
MVLLTWLLLFYQMPDTYDQITLDPMAEIRLRTQSVCSRRLGKDRLLQDLIGDDDEGNHYMPPDSFF